MRCVVYASNWSVIEELEGDYMDGQFTYVRGGFKIPLLGMWIGGDKEVIEFDYEKIVWVSKSEKIGVYMWNGKDLTQLSLKEMPDSSTVVDYVKMFKIGEMQKQLTLTKPIDSVMTAFKLMAYIALLIMIIGLYFTATHTGTVIQSAVKPFNNVSLQNQQQLAFTDNVITSLRGQINATDVLMRNMSAYLQSHVT